MKRAAFEFQANFPHMFHVKHFGENKLSRFLQKRRGAERLPIAFIKNFLRFAFFCGNRLESPRKPCYNKTRMTKRGACRFVRRIYGICGRTWSGFARVSAVMGKRVLYWQKLSRL